jgi:hypothetical protein
VSPDPNNIGHTMFFPAPDASVLALPGDALLLNERVDFIKLDVEGMELEILSGMSATLARWRPQRPGFFATGCNSREARDRALTSSNACAHLAFNHMRIEAPCRDISSAEA